MFCLLRECANLIDIAMWVYVALTFVLATVGDVTSSSYCEDKFGQNNNLPKRYVTQRGTVKNISLYWGSETSYAASALLAVILRYKMGYQNVRLVQGPHDLSALAREVPYNAGQNYKDVILAVSMAWDTHVEIRNTSGVSTGLAGPRLFEFGASSVPVRQKLYVYLMNKYQRQEQCKNVTLWSFYTDTATLKLCGFSLSNNQTETVVVYGPATVYNDTYTTMSKLEKRAGIHLHFKILNRTNFFGIINADNESFLFIGYDMWFGNPNVAVVQPPPCLPEENFSCSQELDTNIAMRVGDVPTLREFAPQMYEVVHNFLPTPQTVREILEVYSEGDNIEEAACEWALKHNTTVASWIENSNPSQKIYEVAVFYCIDDPDNRKYDELLKVLGRRIIRDLYDSLFGIRLRRYNVDCSDAYYVQNKLEYYMSVGIRQRLIGAVVGGVKNVTEVVKRVDRTGLPVLFYDALGIDADRTTSTWTTSGRSLHLAIALHHFLRDMHWIRVGVLSEQTDTATRLLHDLKVVDDSVGFGDHAVQPHLTQPDAENILKKIKEENAHVILINTNYKDAVIILLAAAKLKMNSPKEYAWIVREWRPNDTTSDIHHFTMSFSPICHDDIADTNRFSQLVNKMAEIWGNCSLYEGISWPALGTALADAVLTLLHGFNSSIQKNPQIRDDVHSEEAIRLFGQGLVTSPVQGVTQKLTYKAHSLEEPIVFLYEWYGNKHNRLARWRIYASARKVIEEEQWRAAYPYENIPHDGRSGCIAYSGDLYWPTCYDALWGTLLILLILVPPNIILVYRFVCRRLTEQQKRLLCELLTQRQQRAAALSAGYLVDRSALSFYQKLGAGHFGFVRLAMLRVPGRPQKYVAVKALRDHQEESEILREACMLASLNHENIIRLVGVCIDKDPPLVLMEVAFFGDLHQYLWDRRYLADAADADLLKLEKAGEEAVHVSSEALTRLARQAASALGYLALRGVIHRDLRASNCLVDANRCLKLADFGLARETVSTGLDGGAEYACRRRGLFPVLWMAPESILHGIFSSASDVWALGVLMLELVTLGARPFGDMSPLRVMQFVAAGGKPPIPRDATLHTIALARLCWQREPEQRPTAADVVAYLAERPNALRPALDSFDCDKPADADSGYGESPMSELLPC